MRILFTTPFAIIAHYTLKIQHTTERKSFSFLFFPIIFASHTNFSSVLFWGYVTLFFKTHRKTCFSHFQQFLIMDARISNKDSFLPWLIHTCSMACTYFKTLSPWHHFTEKHEKIITNMNDSMNLRYKERAFLAFNYRKMPAFNNTNVHFQKYCTWVRKKK